MGFILVEEKMGNPACRQHMNGKLGAFIFYFFLLCFFFRDACLLLTESCQTGGARGNVNVIWK